VTAVRLLAARLTNQGSRVLLWPVNCLIPLARRAGTSGHPTTARRLMTLAGPLTTLAEHVSELTTRLYERDWEAAKLPYFEHPRNPRWRHLAERRRKAETKRNA
jgi:hypothetical protein